MAKVLIINDEKGLSALLGHFLTSVGHSVTIAGNSFESLIWLNLAPFDLVVMDVNEIGSEKLEFCRRVKGYPQSAKTRVLVLGEAPCIERPAVDAGADAFLAEPLSLEQIKGLVVNLTRNYFAEEVSWELVA